MRFQRTLSDPRLTPWERPVLAIYNLLGWQPQDLEGALNEAAWFYACGEEPRGEPQRERLLDWEKDFDALWADYRLYYRVDLRRMRYLHWWEFTAMLRSLPGEAEIKRRISIRSMDLSQYRDPQVREAYRKAKEAYALDPPPEEDLWAVYERMGAAP